MKRRVAAFGAVLLAASSCASPLPQTVEAAPVVARPVVGAQPSPDIQKNPKGEIYTLVGSLQVQPPAGASRITDILHARSISPRVDKPGFLINGCGDTWREKDGISHHLGRKCHLRLYSADGALEFEKQHSLDGGVFGQTETGGFVVWKLVSGPMAPEAGDEKECPNHADRLFVGYVDQELLPLRQWRLGCGLRFRTASSRGRVAVLSQDFDDDKPIATLRYLDGERVVSTGVPPTRGSWDWTRQSIIIGDERIHLASTEHGAATEDTSGWAGDRLTLQTFDTNLKRLSHTVVLEKGGRAGKLWADRSGTGFWSETDKGAIFVHLDGSFDEFPGRRIGGAPDLEYGYVDTDGRVTSPDGVKLTPSTKPAEYEYEMAEVRRFEPIRGVWSGGAVAFTFWNGRVQWHQVQ